MSAGLRDSFVIGIATVVAATSLTAVQPLLGVVSDPDASASVAQIQPPMTAQVCRTAVRAGTRPEFSAVVTNRSDRPMRVLDVRQRRRSDLQDVYFELFILEERRLVDLPRAISDPGPISKADYAVLQPCERMEVRPLRY
jgi:hypothetical protein